MITAGVLIEGSGGEQRTVPCGHLTKNTTNILKDAEMQVQPHHAVNTHTRPQPPRPFERKWRDSDQIKSTTPDSPQGSGEVRGCVGRLGGGERGQCERGGVEEGGGGGWNIMRSVNRKSALNLGALQCFHRGRA